MKPEASERLVMLAPWSSMFVVIDGVQLETRPIEISGLQASGFRPPARPTRCRVC